MATLKTKVDMYEQLLGQLKGQVDSAGKLAISKALQGVSKRSSFVAGWLPSSRLTYSCRLTPLFMVANS